MVGAAARSLQVCLGLKIMAEIVVGSANHNGSSHVYRPVEAVGCHHSENEMTLSMLSKILGRCEKNCFAAELLLREQMSPIPTAQIQNNRIRLSAQHSSGHRCVPHMLEGKCWLE